MQAGVAGKQVKTGTTSVSTIVTGLSRIDKLIIYADKIKSIGVVTAVYSADVETAKVTFCDSYSVYLRACGIVDLSGFSVSGGTFSWTETMDAYKFMSNATYNWIAKGIQPDIGMLINIADYFNVSLDYLVGRTDER